MHNNVIMFGLCVLSLSMQPVLGMKREREASSYEREHILMRVVSTRYGRKVYQMYEEKPPHALALHRAESIDAIKKLLETRMDVAATDGNGSTALHVFVGARRTDAVRLLLLYGAPNAQPDSKGNTPLHESAKTAQDVAECLVTSPQGGPQLATDELRAWQQKINLFSYVLKRRRFPKDIRLMVCKKILPKPRQLIAWAPLRNLAHYLQFYPECEKQEIIERLSRRHSLDVILALKAKNKAHYTPQQLAVTRMNLIGMIPPPVGALDVTVLTRLKQNICENYLSLLGLPVAN